MAVTVSTGWVGVEQTYLGSATASGVLLYVMAELDEETLGELVERLRNRLPGKPSRETFAEAADISPSTLEKIENGNTPKPDDETVRRIAVTLSKLSGKKVPVSRLSQRLGWIPVDEVSSDWLLGGLSQEDQELVINLAERLKADDPPQVAAHAPRRAARS